MKRYVLIIFSLILVQVAFAQKKSVLIVPFDAKMYNNQESEKICTYSGVSYEKSVTQIMTALDNSLFLELQNTHAVSSLLRTYTTDAHSDLDIVHENARYYVSEAMPTDIMRSDKRLSSNQNIIAGEIVDSPRDAQNMTVYVALQDSQLFMDLVQNYQVQYIVFVTQFELLGDFSDPYKISEKTYQRTIKAHYSVFNSLGKFVSGNIAEYAFSAKINDIDQICDIFLPKVAQQIARNIP